MATRSPSASRTAERLLEEFRSSDSAVRALYRVHISMVSPSTLDEQTARSAVQYLNEGVCLAVDRGSQHVEYLHHANGGWWSMTESPRGRVGPIALYQHNVDDRLDAGYPVSAERVDQTPFTSEDLGEHDLDADADGVRTDV